eukprot:COSAG05_NODE_1671_length_4303_cov_2.550666_2_plen_71_part_00
MMERRERERDTTCSIRIRVHVIDIYKERVYRCIVEINQTACSHRYPDGGARAVHDAGATRARGAAGAAAA